EILDSRSASRVRRPGSSITADQGRARVESHRGNERVVGRTSDDLQLGEVGEERGECSRGQRESWIRKAEREKVADEIGPCAVRWRQACQDGVGLERRLRW